VTASPLSPLAPGDVCRIRSYGSWCPARVLAVIDRTALIEYEIGETTSLVIAPRAQSGDVETWRRNPFGYDRLPLKWLRAIDAAGIEWAGRSKRGAVAPVAQQLNERDLGHPCRGWSWDDNRWEKAYLGHRLTIESRGGKYHAYVGEMRAGTWSRGSSSGWRLAATGAHKLARKVGKGIRHAR